MKVDKSTQILIKARSQYLSTNSKKKNKKNDAAKFTTYSNQYIPNGESSRSFSVPICFYVCFALFWITSFIRYYIYILIYIYIYIYIYITYIKNQTFISKRVIFRFLPNLRRLNKITKKVKSANLKTN